MTTLYLYIFIPSTINTQRGYVTAHKVPNLSEAIIQVKKRGFKEIEYYPSIIVWSDDERNTNNYCVIGKMQDGFEFYRSVSHKKNDDKNIVVTSKIVTPVLVLRVDQYSIMGIDLAGVTLNPAQIFVWTMHVQDVILSLSGDWISQEQSQFSTKQNNRFVSWAKS
jgi:hypothetical protein